MAPFFLPMSSGLCFSCRSRENTQKASQGEQSFLHVTHHLDWIYMPTKYYQNILKGIKAIERTNFCLQTDVPTRWRDNQTDTRLIPISPEPCQSGDKKGHNSVKKKFK